MPFRGPIPRRLLWPLSGILFSLSSATWAQAAEPAKESFEVEEITVTATRRQQDLIKNNVAITAISGETIAANRLVGADEIARYVPGLTVIDRGPRDTGPDAIIRGLNTATLGPGFSGSPASYFGDIPLLLDIKPVDLERVEVLSGPQGTLYGLGTLAGAIRYIPQSAKAEKAELLVRTQFGQNAESDGIAQSYGATINLPVIENTLALRVNLDQTRDPGFIDYDNVLANPGFSNPEIASELRQVADANGERTRSLRANLRLTPHEKFTADLWYFSQKTDAEGRQITHREAAGSGDYVSAYRYLEPLWLRDELVSLNLEADVGWASATAIYGRVDTRSRGQRDQTDLQLLIQPFYATFPQFSSFTREHSKGDSTVAEVRLVSSHTGPLSWVAGYFDFTTSIDSSSREFTPGLSDFLVDTFADFDLTARPDNLEFIQVNSTRAPERAFYGELAWALSDQLSATLGYRRYLLEISQRGGQDTPLLATAFSGQDPNEINLEFLEQTAKENGDLFKFNITASITPEQSVFFNYSQGYRGGGVNLVSPCSEADLTAVQADCALPQETSFDADSVDNFELGYRSYLFNKRVAIASTAYYMDWSDIQLGSTTQNGNRSIVANGGDAEALGLELSGQWLLNRNFSVNFNYAYTRAELAEDASGLINGISTISAAESEQFGLSQAGGPGLRSTIVALKGSRLPGHAEHQGSVSFNYKATLSDRIGLTLRYAVNYSSAIANVVGGSDDSLEDRIVLVAADGSTSGFDARPADFGGEYIDSYALHSFSATLSRAPFELQFFADNLLNEVYVSGTRTTRRHLTAESGGSGINIGTHTLRRYGEFVGPPRTIGIAVNARF